MALKDLFKRNTEEPMEEPMEEPQVFQKAINKDDIRKAMETLKKYKEGKANLENKIKSNEQWWKLRHWEQMNADKLSAEEPTSAWLFNVIISKHADAMDSYPEPNILPREDGDKEEAKRLSSIIPCVLDQNKFEKVYSDEEWYKLRQGTGVFMVLWNQQKLNGLGDIDISKVDLLRLFWEPGIENIQESKNVFYCELVDNDILETTYPELEGNLKGSSLTLSEYYYDDNVDTSNKSLVVNWYYKKNINGKQTVQYVKFVEEEIIYATENMTQPELEERPDPTAPTSGNTVMVETGAPISERGLYDHGMYPFVFDTLFPLEGTPCGFGFVDVCKSPQRSIDLMNSAIERNALMAALPRYIVREDGSINEDEFANWKKQIIHTNGNLGEDSIRQITVNPLNDIYVGIVNNKIAELKETSGNRDVNNGGTSSGVTAYSAIVAMQEQSGKGSRDSTAESYRAYQEVIYMVIELIRQFYDMPRQFRILGEFGEQEFMSYSNEMLQPQPIESMGGEQMYRLPVFDIDVQPQKANRYTQMAQNELAIQMYQLGFFNPQMADQALACLETMDFDDKQSVIQKVQMNGTLAQKLAQTQAQLIQMAEMLDAIKGTNMAEQLSSAILQEGGQPVPQLSEDLANIPTEEEINQNKLTRTLGEKATAQAQASAQPK
jgi:hypothetical protein